MLPPHGELLIIPHSTPKLGMEGWPHPSPKAWESWCQRHKTPKESWLCPLPEGSAPVALANQLSYHPVPHPGPNICPICVLLECSKGLIMRKDNHRISTTGATMEYPRGVSVRVQ